MPKSFIWFTTALLCLELAYAANVPRGSVGFPNRPFDMPTSVPSSLNGWWAGPSTEVAFLGFSYSVTPCTSPFVANPRSSTWNLDPIRFLGQNASTLINEFTNMRDRYNARYVRLHGACDQGGF